MTAAKPSARSAAAHREGLGIIEKALGKGDEPVLGLYLYTAVAKMLDELRRSPRYRKISPHLIGTPAILAARPRISQIELARFLGCERATAGLQVKACVRNGWVRRTTSEQDARRYVLELTAKGEKMLRAVTDTVAEHERQAFKDLSTADKLKLRALLLTVIAAG